MKFLKELYEINNYYWKERRIFWIFITSAFILAFQFIAFSINNVIVKVFGGFLFFILFILFVTIISFIPIILTFKKIEECLQSNKNTNFKNFLIKIIKIELYLKNNLAIRISILILTIVILIFILIQKNMLNSYFTSYLMIVALALYIQIQFFINDFLSINKKEFKNKEIK